MIPVKTRKAPNTTIIHSNWWSSADPARMKTKRKTIAPRIPRNSTRCWRSPGIRKYSNSTMNTNRLSTESDFSIRYAVKNSSAAVPPRVK